MSKLLSLLLLLLLFISTLHANTRALKKVFTQNGIKITEYSNSYALLIGVSNYTNGWPSLHTIPSELDDISKALKSKGFNITRVNSPTSRELKNAYNDFVDNYGYDKNNRLLFFYSGHGYSTNNGNKGYLVPSDAPNPNNNLTDFKRKSLKMNTLLSLSRNMEANHALFLFDSCFSGTIFKTRALPKKPPHIQKSIAKPVRQFITAGSAGQEVPAESVFVPLFIDGINGKADLSNDGYVTGSELGMFLSQNVPKYKKQNPEYGKIKDYELSQGDFVFLLPNQTKKTQKSKKSSSFSFSDEVATIFSLTINTQPRDAKVQITNIVPRYYKGMKLEAGRYTIKVSKEGYYSKSGTINLEDDLDVDIKLKKKKSEVSVVAGKWNPKIFLGKRSYTKNSTNTVKDNYTELIWQKGRSNSKMNWSNAKEYCHNLTLDGFSGFTLPTKKELYYLADRSNYYPAINETHFDETSEWYWSSTEYTDNSSQAWGVNFDNGPDRYYAKSTEFFVRCVWGRQ